MDLLEKVEKALNQIRPYLEADGGNVRILEITDNGILKLEFVGSCGNCPMSEMTFKAGIEATIRQEVPEIKAIEAVNLTTAI
ncbi:NifU family protein [Raineya orbicola]|jgi:Fe-S cluster biogenesis protein NfuA|uniref:Thioredoxin-like protein n=1 Tax=Raineya orbicola TaxID=2016530 RepID=A0A2N3IJQ5_9BACT|nr:NifU family protein [Raineya orbicola]PKQ70549.1 Thioredoxin-like protein [Raineya orbicola]